MPGEPSAPDNRPSALNAAERIKPALPLSRIPEGSTIPKRSQIYKARLAASRTQLAETRGELQTAQQDTMYDANTGLHNNRWLEERVSNALKTAQRTGKGFYLLFMDLDDFKKYNTRYTHAGGDKVLGLLKSIKTRPGEEVARFAGDEFAQVLNDDIELGEAVTVSLRNANIVAEQSRLLIPQMRVIDSDTAPIDQVTMSLGLIECTPGMTYEEIKERASAAMLEGKKSGKDMVTISTAEGKTRMFNRDGTEYLPNAHQGRIHRILAPLQRLIGRVA
ncbi:MAG: Diguanylate cyclase [uncultured bacterium]|nr:MAG: Diguanylate cyclase [uncultured bacterium]